MQDPTLILMFPRSGSSLIANIFYKHGAWVGNSLLQPNASNPDGYFENKRIKNYIVDLFGTPSYIYENGLINFDSDKFRTRIENILFEEDYKGGSWIFKCNSVYGFPFINAFPNSNIVCIRRKKGDIINSVNESYFKLRTDLIGFHWQAMEDVIEKQGGVTINYENLIQGNYLELEESLKESGFEPNKQIIEETVRR